ncbi:MAG: alpha/beta fold hydrolase [Burkholderiaceae bacterium]
MFSRLALVPGNGRRARSWLAAWLLVGLLAACGGGSDPAPPSADSDGATNGADPGTVAPSDTAAETPAPPPAFVPANPDPALGGMQVFRRGDTRWLTYELRAAGAGAPRLLLLHDAGNSSLQWRPLIAAMPPAWGIVAPDLAGHGNSADAACCLAGSAQVQDLLALLDSESVGSVTVVGSGTGSVLARELARAAPDRIERLVLIGSDTTAADRAGWVALRDQTINFDTGADARFLAQWNVSGTGAAPSAAQAFATLAPAQRRVGLATWTAGMDLLATASDAATLDALPQPSLLLAGTDDPLLGPPAMARLAGALRHEVSLPLAGAGRYPEIDQPAQVSALLTRFVAPRGTLHEAIEVALRTVVQINSLTESGVARFLARDLTGEAFCDVRLHQIEYQTVGGAGESTNATAGIGVPEGSHPECQGPRPVLLYAHGTKAERDSSVLDSTEVFGGVIMGIFAARGYIVVAPDYVGYGRSWLDYHPYLNAQAQADDMIDALRAARQWFAQTGRATSALFISGYSQGGHVAMATHKRMEQAYPDEFTITGSMPMSGPYDLAGTAAQILAGRATPADTQLLPFLVEGFQRAYGDLYTRADEVFAPPYDQTALDLFPGTLGAEESIAQGLLPPVLLSTQGPQYLIQPDFLTDYQTDGFNPLAVAFRRNSLLDWAPRAPMALCGGGKDPLVFFDNSFKARDAFFARGVLVPTYDLNDSASLPGGVSNSVYLRFRSLFLFTTSLDTYHTAVAPFCAHYARDFFSGKYR